MKCGRVPRRPPHMRWVSGRRRREGSDSSLISCSVFEYFTPHADRRPNSPLFLREFSAGLRSLTSQQSRWPNPEIPGLAADEPCVSVPMCTTQVGRLDAAKIPSMTATEKVTQFPSSTSRSFSWPLGKMNSQRCRYGSRLLSHDA